jgi:hypothetical protein
MSTMTVLLIARKIFSANQPMSHGAVLYGKSRMGTYWGMSQTIEHHLLSSCSLRAVLVKEKRTPS